MPVNELGALSIMHPLRRFVRRPLFFVIFTSLAKLP